MIFGFIGLGTAGTTYSAGLIRNGATVKGYSRSIGTAQFAPREERCRALGIRTVHSLEELVTGSDLIIAVTTPASAYEMAEAAAPFLREGQLYVELNSAVPEEKLRIARLLGNASMIDGTTMSSINQTGYAAQINLSGPRAAEVTELLRGYGMNVTCLGDQIGQASALKAVRSVFMKGFEAVLMECACAGFHYGIAEEIFRSLSEYFDARKFDEHIQLFVTTDAVFSQRRGEEVRAVAEMLAAAGLDNRMSAAAAEKLRDIAALGMAERFGNRAPEDRMALLRAMAEAHGGKGA